MPAWKLLSLSGGLSRYLLGQAESHLNAKARRGARVGIRYKGLVHSPLEVALHRELLIDNVADVRP